MEVKNPNKFSGSVVNINSPFHSDEAYRNHIKAIKRRLLKDKFLCSSCYITFGLSGLIYILLNIYLNKFITKNLIENTIKSVYLAGAFVVFSWLMEHIVLVISLLYGVENDYNLLINSIKNYYSVVILLISLSLSIVCFIKPFYQRKIEK